VSRRKCCGEIIFPPCTACEGPTGELQITLTGGTFAGTYSLALATPDLWAAWQATFAPVYFASIPDFPCEYLLMADLPCGAIGMLAEAYVSAGRMVVLFGFFFPPWSELVGESYVWFIPRCFLVADHALHTLCSDIFNGSAWSFGDHEEDISPPCDLTTVTGVTCRMV